MSDWQFSGSNFSNWGVPPGVEAGEDSGPSYKNQNGNSYSKQVGDSTSLQFGNKNSFQNGISNSALVGASFSTNVAATVSTLVGSKFSFELAASASVSAALKMTLNKSTEYVCSSANKYTLHSSGGELNAKYKETSAQKAKTDFISQVEEWYVDKDIVITSLVQKVLNGDMSYGALKTTVATDDTKVVVGTHKITAGRHLFSGGYGSQLEITPLRIRMKGLMSVNINGAKINIG